MKKMKRMAALLLSSVLALSATACGGNNGTPQGTTGGGNTQSTTAAGGNTQSTTAAGGSGEESITCSLLVWTPSEDQSPDYGNWIQTQCDAFAKDRKSVV